MTPEGLEQAINYRFSRRELLAQALTHRSHSTPHNERLEFLGDSVLNCVVASLLYGRFPALKEGELSRLRASMVKQETLAGVASALGLGNTLRLGEGEIKSGGQHRPSILADALEALFGAVYLDSGFDRVAAVIDLLFRPLLDHADPLTAGKDAKTELQEYLQGQRLGLPRYELRATRGEAHAQQFDVDCQIPELGINSSGSGPSHRIAEQEAAQRALEMVRAK